MLSMKAKYALRALTVMAMQEKKTMQVKAIANLADVPVKFLETILQELKREGILISKRGIFGGYSLAKPPSEIMTGQIVRLIDGSLAPLACASSGSYKKCDDCTNEEACIIRRIMIDVRNVVSNVLDGRSILDMMNLSPRKDEQVFW